MKTANEIIQWIGTAFILVMYALMNFFPELHPWNIVMGLAGAVCFFTWAWRVANKPQMLINGVAIVVCCLGLLKVVHEYAQQETAFDAMAQAQELRQQLKGN